MSDAPRLQSPPGDQRPVKRGEPLWQAAVLARAATQSMFLSGSVSWHDGWIGTITPGNVTILQDDEIVVSMPIYEAARLHIEGD